MDKLQPAGRDFLMRLIAKHGPRGAARVLRALADELDGLLGAAVPKMNQVVAVDRGAGH
jgi:hypothetical protein